MMTDMAHTLRRGPRAGILRAALNNPDLLPAYRPRLGANCAAKRGLVGRRYVAPRTAAAAVSIIVTTSSGWETIAT